MSIAGRRIMRWPEWPPARHRGDELLAVARRPGHHRRVRGVRRERVHVVHRRTRGQAVAERRVPAPGDLVPADLGHLQATGAERLHPALEQAETAVPAHLRGGLEQQLHAEADTEDRHACIVALADGTVEAELGIARIAFGNAPTPGSTSASAAA